MNNTNRPVAKLTLVAGLTYVLGAFAIECHRYLPSLVENALGETASIDAPAAREIDEMLAHAANYFFFNGGRRFTLDNLHPWGFSALLPGPDDYSSDIYETAICNELGSCGKVTIWSQHVSETSVSVPIGPFPVSQDVGLTVEEYNIEVQFLGQTTSQTYDAKLMDTRYRNGKSNSSYDPRYPIPPSPPGDPPDLRCRDSDGNLAGGSTNNTGPLIEYDPSQYYDYWDTWWLMELDNGGISPACLPDFTDPHVTGVVCYL